MDGSTTLSIDPPLYTSRWSLIVNGGESTFCSVKTTSSLLCSDRLSIYLSQDMHSSVRVTLWPSKHNQNTPILITEKHRGTQTEMAQYDKVDKVTSNLVLVNIA